MWTWRRRGWHSGRAVFPVVEALETRRLLSFSSSISHASENDPLDFVSLSQTQPSVTSTNPANGETGVMRDAFIAATVQLVNAGHGVDSATLSTDTVKIYRTSDKQFVNSLANTTGGGDAIVVRPTAILASNTNYTFEVTSGVKDTSGASFKPFKMTFTTGTGVKEFDAHIRFEKFDLPNAQGRRFISLTFGPDGKLYAGTMDGAILRFPVQSNGQLGTPEVISTVKNKNGEDRFIMGMAFDPTSTADNLIMWVTHGQGVLDGAREWSGKLSRLRGPTLSQYTDFVINLPRSVRDHLTNQLHFGPDEAIYFNQGAMNAMGAADVAWARPERLLSAAMLRVEVRSINAVVDVKTPEGGGTYNPFAPGALVTIYATGLRNVFDFVFHSNGRLYAPNNGSAAGGDTPAGPNNNPPALVNVQQTMNDHVYDVIPGGYYGHPNPLRGQYVLMGGNPTAGEDYEEVTDYPVGTMPHSNFQQAAFNMGANYAPTGIIEYKSNSFGGRLKGRMLVARYSGGDDIFILTPSADGKTLTGISGVGLDGFFDPVDLVEDTRNGNLYVTELSDKGGMKITLLKPVELPEVIAFKLVDADRNMAIGALKNRAVINLAELPTRNLSVRADTAGSVGSVVWGLNDNPNHQTENFKPYTLHGKTADGGYIGWTPPVGEHTITATPYMGSNGSGFAGADVTITFTVIDRPQFRLNVNFQPPSSTFTFPFHRTDIGRAFGVRANGLSYGWSASNEDNMFKRNVATPYDERFDSGAIMAGRVWEVVVPNGNYDVYVAAGDPTDTTGNYAIDVEGVLAISGSPSASRPWLGNTVRVTVNDGRLTISARPGSTNNKLNMIQIASV